MAKIITENHNPHDPVSRLEELEERYDLLAQMLEPDEMAETDPSRINTYIRALQGVERCVKMRLAIVKEEPPGKTTPLECGFVTVDLPRLSDDALREVKAALLEPAAMSNLLKPMDESKRKMNKGP